MRYDLLKKIEAADPLARLFNQYLKSLSTLAVMAEPSYVTMAEVRTRYTGTGKRKEIKHLKHSTRRFFELTVLRNSLHDIHHHVLEAITLLENFFTAYGGDLLRYAIEQRLRSIDQYGSDEDGDWEEDGLTPEGTTRWKVTYKDDEASLTHYTLHAELAYHFGHENRGEYLGTSGPADFYPYTTLVEHQSDFSFRKMLSATTGQDITFSRIGEDGTQTPMTLADHIEDELNQDIRAGELVHRFNTVLGTCATLALAYRQLPPTAGPAAYQHLLDCLRQVRDVQTDKQPPF